MFKATVLLCLLAVAYSIEISCMNTGNFGFLPEVITDCLTGETGSMSLSVYYQVTLAGSGNATVTGEVDYDTVNLYKIVPLSITNTQGDATISVSEGYTLNPCQYAKLQDTDPTLILNELFANEIDITANSTLSYLVYNRLQSANITFDTPFEGTTPAFGAIADYFVFDFSSENQDDMYEITITLQATDPSGPNPFVSLEVAGAGNCVENYPAAKSLGLAWTATGNATATFNARAGDWNIGIFTAATNTPYSIVLSKKFVGAGVCDEYGFCEAKSTEHDATKIALIVVSVFFGVFVIGAVAYFLYSRRKRADYSTIH